MCLIGLSSEAPDQRVCTAGDAPAVTGVDVIAYVDRLVDNCMIVCGGSQLRALVVAIAYVEEERLRPESRLMVEGGLPFMDGVLVLLRDRLTALGSDPLYCAGVLLLLAGA
ncbi:hypothetical protein GALL_248710 [mine drainage metagenome]|uniref:Uncharacterized protein n=1 Tax=mine drainage metagenome TaxID=410659 RepID=A0A1J5RYG6_9ZZZZ